jgi:hypothetical protein
MYHHRYGHSIQKTDPYEKDWTWRQKYEEKGKNIIKVNTHTYASRLTILSNIRSLLKIICGE